METTDVYIIHIEISDMEITYMDIKDMNITDIETTDIYITDIHTMLARFLLLFIRALRDTYFHVIVRRYGPLEVDSERKVVVIGGKLPEQAGTVLVSGHSDL